MHLCASKINAGICVSLLLSFIALHVIGIKCVRVTVGAIGQSVRRGGMWRSFRIEYRVVAVAASKCVFYHHMFKNRFLSSCFCLPVNLAQV